MLTKPTKRGKFGAAKMPDSGLCRYEDSVLSALSDSRWDYRTAEGIAEETGISLEVVNEILSSSDKVRRLSVPDKNGRPLYALRSRHNHDLRELTALARTILTGSPK
jgi:hypothetical protein